MTEGPMPPLPESCWPVDVTCVPDWDATNGSGMDATPVYTEDQKAKALALAGQTMRMLTGYRVGGCPVTIRPCREGCNPRTYRGYPVIWEGPGVAPWSPVLLGGEWLNIGCGHTGGCSCTHVPEVRIPGPVSTVLQVKVGGFVLDPSAYRLDAGARLVRTDGVGWPVCQDMVADDTHEDTWSVTYLPAAPVDGLGAMMAGILAGEYVKACAGQSCGLPDTATSVIRNGVTVTLTPGAFPGGKTGIKVVDGWVEVWNPNGLARGPRSVAWSPDVVRPRRTTVAGQYVPPQDGVDGGSA